MKSVQVTASTPDGTLLAGWTTTEDGRHVVRNNAPDHASLAALVRSFYSLQRLRIQNGNRVIAAYKISLGGEPSQSEDELSPEAQKILAQMRIDYQKITDAVPSMLKLRRDFHAEGMITGYAQYCLISEYIKMEEAEDAHETNIKHIVKEFPIWREFMEKVPGCGPLMASVIICRIDPHKAKYASSIWKFAGLDVAQDGRGRGRFKDHLVPRTYTNAKNEVKETVGITFDPFLKTKLIGVLGPNLLKSAAVTKNGTKKYAEAYYNYKNRLENHPAHKEKTPKHRHNMAIRFMVKRFLVDLYMEWRALEGLEVYAEYSEAKLGLKHGSNTATDLFRKTGTTPADISVSGTSGEQAFKVSLESTKTGRVSSRDLPPPI